MDKVQNKPNSSVQHTPSSESFQVQPEAFMLLYLLQCFCPVPSSIKAILQTLSWVFLRLIIPPFCNLREFLRAYLQPFSERVHTNSCFASYILVRNTDI
jgi:hypothetical protein